MNPCRKSNGEICSGNDRNQNRNQDSGTNKTNPKVNWFAFSHNTSFINSLKGCYQNRTLLSMGFQHLIGMIPSGI